MENLINEAKNEILTLQRDSFARLEALIRSNFKEQVQEVNDEFKKIASKEELEMFFNDMDDIMENNLVI